MARGVVAVAKTGLGMRALDTALLIMCIICSLSWLLVMGWAWGGRNIVAAGRSVCNDGYQGGVKFVNKVLDNGRRW